MKKIDTLILKSFFGPFIMSLGVILFILVLQFLAYFMADIFGKGIGIAVIGKLFLFVSGKLLVTALPVAIVAGALMALGNMGEYNELAALKSSGVGLFRMGLPLIVLGICFSGLSMWMTHEVVPASNLKFYNLVYDIIQKKADVSIKPGHFYSDIEPYTIRISDKNPETRTLYDIVVYNHQDGQDATDVITADSARTQADTRHPDVMKMVLYSGVRHENYDSPSKSSQSSHGYGRTYFDSLYYSFTLKGFDMDTTDKGYFANHPKTLTQTNLKIKLHDLQEQGKDSQINRYQYEYYLRNALPLHCLIFMMIGISLGALIGKGGMGLPALISLVFMVLIYLVEGQGKTLTQKGMLDPFLGAFLSVMVFAPIAIWLMVKSGRNA